MPQFDLANLPTITGLGNERVQASPFQFYLTGAENLRVTSCNSLTGVTVVVQARTFGRDGKAQWQAFRHTPNTDGTMKSSDFPMGECVIANLVVFAEGASPVIGQTFVQVKVILGDTGATMVLGTLVQGYITSKQERAWPGSPLQSSEDGGGYTRVVTGGALALATEWSVTVPAGRRWEPVAILAKLVCSATAVFRRPDLVVSNGANRVLFLQCLVTPGANNTCTPQWVQGASSALSTANEGPILSLPAGFSMLAGMSFSTSTVNLQAGDQYVSTSYIVREWLQIE